MRAAFVSPTIARRNTGESVRRRPEPTNSDTFSSCGSNDQSGHGKGAQPVAAVNQFGSVWSSRFAIESPATLLAFEHAVSSLHCLGLHSAARQPCYNRGASLQCPCPPGLTSARMKCSRSSARVAWGRFIAPVVSVLMSWAIVASANHFFVDMAMGAAVVAFSWYLARRLERRLASRPLPERTRFIRFVR